MGNRVKGKVAIVIGAGSIGPGMGNGKASAIAYAREGAKVMLVDCNSEALKETERLIKKESGQCMTAIADVTKSSDCESLANACFQTFGRIDILHNNVGITEPGGVVETDEESWDRVINVNLKSMFLTCKYVLPYMDKQGSGCIVNISSIAGIRALPFPDVSYTASKAGVIALTRDISIQYAAKGIRANAILPGFMDTPMIVAEHEEIWGTEIDEIRKQRDALCPSGKQGDAWDVAYAALYLVSDEAKYVTGVALIVDGGVTQRIR